jgi:hypothetical protein
VGRRRVFVCAPYVRDAFQACIAAAALGFRAGGYGGSVARGMGGRSYRSGTAGGHTRRPPGVRKPTKSLACPTSCPP